MAEALWTGVASAYARSFATLCAGVIPTLVEWLPSSGRLLDVGCGTGDLAAAGRLRGLDVIAAEPDPEMAATAMVRAKCDVLVAGLPHLPIPHASFDAVTANFVLNHVDDPWAAARELRRVAAPGGIVSATIWGSSPPPHALMWSDLLSRVHAARPPLPRLTPAADFARSPEGMASLLESAGLRVAEAKVARWTWQVEADDLWVGLTSIGNFGVVWRAQPPDIRLALRRAFDAVGTPQRTNGSFAFDVACVAARARC